MFGLSAFRRKPRQYSYTPRYWDPEKEEMERRLHPEKESEKPYVPGSYIRDSRMRRLYDRDTKKKNTNHSPAIIRTLIVMVLLGFLAWVIFKSPVIDMFVLGLR